jgi:hypothetical protein
VYACHTTDDSPSLTWSRTRALGLTAPTRRWARARSTTDQRVRHGQWATGGGLLSAGPPGVGQARACPQSIAMSGYGRHASLTAVAGMAIMPAVGPCYDPSLPLLGVPGRSWPDVATRPNLLDNPWISSSLGHLQSLPSCPTSPHVPHTALFSLPLASPGLTSPESEREGIERGRAREGLVTWSDVSRITTSCGAAGCGAGHVRAGGGCAGCRRGGGAGPASRRTRPT